ncbi:MAG TPA: single-stranded-DNA-specific exonuclease RecJ [Gemmatimonadales bacterium]|nr:single-stranded-DNA-specific exonuclease RecJ [Gemmatimonadales bacterium]
MSRFPDRTALMVSAAFPRAVRLVYAPAPDEAVLASLAGALSVPRPLASLLLQRGIGDVDAARRFLRPALEQLGDPLAMGGMAGAVEAVAAAVRSGKPILVHGDYDVDGQCAAALLTRALRAAGAAVEPFVPHRMEDGYDFREAGLARAREVGAGLILTCDCGITAVETVAAARAEGLEVVVTDHHLPGASLPPATALLDPQLDGDDSPYGMLCGTGVAFKLVQALVPALGLPPNLPLHLLDYVALATVADVVPLQGENRPLVQQGLKILAASRWPGLRALIASAGLQDKPIKAGHLGFVLGPRLNATGRVGDAKDGLRLLLTDDDDEARRLAAQLERQNAERQALDQRILDEAIAQVETTCRLDEEAAIVLAADGWHAGVIGIVASRLVERYGRPAFMIAFDEGTTALGKGSGRSISRFHLRDALAECGDLLDRFGGHRMAAGLTIQRDRVPAFRERFVAEANRRLDQEDLVPEQRVDVVLRLDEATAELESLCQHLEPCGMGNAGPVFAVRGVLLEGAREVGKGHLKGTLRAAGTALDAIGFNMLDQAPPAGAPVDVAFKLERNTWRDRDALQARLLAVVPASDER